MKEDKINLHYSQFQELKYMCLCIQKGKETVKYIDCINSCFNTISHFIIFILLGTSCIYNTNNDKVLQTHISYYFESEH